MRTPQPSQCQLSQAHVRRNIWHHPGKDRDQHKFLHPTDTSAGPRPGACMGRGAVVVCPSQPPVWGQRGWGRAGPGLSPSHSARARPPPPGRAGGVRGGGPRAAAEGRRQGREAGKEAGRRRAPALEVGGRMVSGLRGGRGGRGAAGFVPPSAWFVSPNPKTTARAQPGAAGAAARPHRAERGPGLLHGTGLCREKWGGKGMSPAGRHRGWQTLSVLRDKTSTGGLHAIGGRVGAAV